MKLKTKIWTMVALVGLMLPFVTACTDNDPDDEYLYTFTGQMMSEYLKSHAEYSGYTEIVEKAGLMDLLSAYGTYTCFVPSNEAVQKYLEEHNMSSVADLSAEQCDTIARAHLATTIYSTFDLITSDNDGGKGGFINMNKRFIDAKMTRDANNQAVILLNDAAIIAYETQNDSVQNGMVQPIDAVLENSTLMIPEEMKKNPNISLYYYAFEKTGLNDTMMVYEDFSYVRSDEQFRYKSGTCTPEIAITPEKRLIGFTAFVVPDATLLAKGYITTDPKADRDQALKELYATAQGIYGGSATFDESTLKNADNPLRKFMAYHVLPRKVEKPEYLTVRDDVGLYTNLWDPTEWYETLLPYAMMKVSKYTCKVSSAPTLPDTLHYVNRRYDNLFSIPGSKVNYSVESEYKNNCENGYYFYVDDIIKYDTQVRENVFNARMRVDMSALFPELMTNAHRMNGDYQDGDGDATINKNKPNQGYCYWYPQGYLTGVTLQGTGKLVYRRPRWGFYSYNGDEMIVQENFDVSFRLPPVATAGNYQVRLGYAGMKGVRTIAQFYFGEEEVPTTTTNLPVDMDVQMTDASLLGENFKILYNGERKNYYEVRNAAYPATGEGDQDAKDLLAKDQKVLKNKGFYRGAFGCGPGIPSKNEHAGYNGNSEWHWTEQSQTFRIVLCSDKPMVPGKYYYIRIRKATNLIRGNNECMLDYIEVVPKSVYGISEGDNREDDL